MVNLEESICINQGLNSGRSFFIEIAIIFAVHNHAGLEDAVDQRD